jgi:hypothetical protein
MFAMMAPGHLVEPSAIAVSKPLLPKYSTSRQASRGRLSTEVKGAALKKSSAKKSANNAADSSA